MDDLIKRKDAAKVFVIGAVFARKKKETLWSVMIYSRSLRRFHPYS